MHFIALGIVGGTLNLRPGEYVGPSDIHIKSIESM